MLAALRIPFQVLKHEDVNLFGIPAKVKFTLAEVMQYYNMSILKLL